MGLSRPRIREENLITFAELDPVTGDELLPIFKFRINPKQLSVQKRKLEKYVFTKIGFERQGWGNDLFQYSYNGSTGVFRRDEAVLPSQFFDITRTLAWQKFREFNTFWEGQREGVVKMQAWMEDRRELVGSLPDFSYVIDADNHPFHIVYQFTFVGASFGPDTLILESGA